MKLEVRVILCTEKVHNKAMIQHFRPPVLLALLNSVLEHFAA